MSDYVLWIALGVIVVLFFLTTRLGKVSSEAARKLVSEGALLVDVRSPGEFAGGHLDGAINVPVDAVGARASELVGRGKPIVVYCASGMRSGSAASRLKKAGAQVFDLGAMSRW
ncbi:MAG: rhodanese-like domain-containing protein [Myxococcales bacterium]|nr:rhodanese-like domain-containing protein [Myxococcales bacterium]